MLKRSLLTLAATAVILLAVVLIRTLGLESRVLDIPPAPPLEVDIAGAAERLARGLTFRTVSYGGGEPVPAAEFFALHEHLERSYPRVHASLAREIISEYSLLYTWKGRDTSLAPALLMAHQDVVPVDEADWQHPPFGGEVNDGVLWGRGALDDKGSLFAILEAVESMLAEGVVPRRTILLFFGHDEELGGPYGAPAAASLLESRGVSLEWVVDEGGFVVDGLVPGMENPIALVGIAEKGSVTLKLSVDMAGGHSSIPPRHTAIGIMASAITKLETNPMPGGIDDLTQNFLESLAPELPFAMRAVLANLWLFGGIIEAAMAQNPPLDAMQRTTTAVTIVKGGVKSNVLPSHVEATVNFRTRPGDTAQIVREHVVRVIDDERIEVSQPSGSREATAVASDTGSAAFEALRRSVAEVFPGVPVVPYVVVGGTDSRRFYPLTRNVYRFNPFRFGAGRVRLVHGTDERVPVDQLGDAIRFYVALIRNSGA